MRDNSVRRAVDVTLTVILSFVLWGFSGYFVWNWPYWVCFVVSAVIVFLGELLVPAVLDIDKRI